MIEEVYIAEGGDFDGEIFIKSKKVIWDFWAFDFIEGKDPTRRFSYFFIPITLKKTVWDIQDIDNIKHSNLAYIGDL